MVGGGATQRWRLWADVRQGIGRLVVGAVDVVEFTFVEASRELLNEEAVGGHVWVLGVPMPGDLLDHQIGVPVAENPLDVH